MSDEQKPQFLWVDLETTGLDPRECRILEWAAVICADFRGGDMSTIEKYSSVIGCDSKKWAEIQKEMDPYVLNMHTKNGLLAECIESDTTLAESEDFLISLIETEPARSVVIAGSTPAFDWRFLVYHMPKLAGYLSHRTFDVSTLKMAERSWAGERFKKAEAHRALPDILESIAHAKEIRDQIERWSVK